MELRSRNEAPLIQLRKLIRSNIKTVIAFVEQNYIRRENDRAVTPDQPICMFCASNGQITKEHIIPRWIFRKDTKSFFNITLNGQSQTYNKSTIPACQKCNSDLLNFLELKIQLLFSSPDLQNKSFSKDGLEDLILWLELIDYKFHIMNISKQFLSPKGAEHIPYLRDFPLFMLLPNKDFSMSKVLKEIRSTLYRLSVKDKKDHINSVIIFKTKNKEDHFLHTLNEFIFLELPKYGLAIFYFYNRTFESNEAAYESAMKIIKEVY